MKNVNSTEIGNELRDRVYNLCVASGKRNVHREYDVKGKAVDVYFEDSADLSGDKVYVIECKKYANPLGVTEWRAIYTDYHSRKASFDHLLIVTEKGITDSLRKVIEDNDWVTHYTWQEFLYRFIHFRSYFTSLSLLLREDNLEGYYIPPKNTDGEDVETLVMDWIAAENNQPLAFLAGYGMGKSSLSKYLASTLAPKFIDGTFNRIPIYIKLGGLFDQQNIESLITHYFTAEHQIPSMTPTLFKEMNRQGLLLIIFDGFDEMKHGMTYSQFKNIFLQIKKLVVGNARLMVLGRPSALTSENDRAVLFGTENCENELLTAVKESVKFKEITLAEFDDEQLETFVKGYLLTLNKQLARSDALSDHEINCREKEVLSPKFRDLIRRPVHADMLCQIAMYSVKAILTQTSKYKLYQSFVNLILEREVGKQARQAIDEKQRLKFLLDMAWHFWPEKGLTGFTVAQLRNAKVFFPNRERPNDDIHREMLVGSLLEQKEGALYFFAHRSFQEYLVAQYIIQNPRLHHDIDKINSVITPEIMEFVLDSDYAIDLAIKVFDALDTLKKPLNLELLSLFNRVSLDALSKHIRSITPTSLNPKQSYIYAGIEYRYQKNQFDISLLRKGECQAGALLGLLYAIVDINEVEKHNILGIVLVLAKSLVERADLTKDRLKNQVVVRDTSEQIWANSLIALEPEFDVNNELKVVKVETSKLFDAINNVIEIVDLRGTLLGVTINVKQLDRIIQQAINLLDGKETDRDQRHTEYRRLLVHFLRTRPSENSFVFDKTKILSRESEVRKREVLSLNKQ